MFGTDAYFQKVVPNFAHPMNRLKLGMKQGLEGEKRALRQGAFTDKLEYL
jgi:hypothetical protein